MRTMQRTVATLALAAILAAPAVSASAAKPPAPGCHVVAVAKVVEHYLLGTTGPTRTVTTTTTKCRGRLSTTVTYGPWSAW